MQACIDWVLIIFVSQSQKKKLPVWSLFPDYLSFSYDYTKISRFPRCSDHMRQKKVRDYHVKSKELLYMKHLSILFW